jgi:ferritin-like protein
MQIPHEQLVDFMRSIHTRPGGTGAMLNLIRASEVRGAADIATLSDLVADIQLKFDLARHAADEARHAYLLLRRMAEIGFSAFRLPPELDRVEALLDRNRARDVKQVYMERGMVGDAELMELIISAFLPERDAVGKLKANFDALAGDPKTQGLIGAILKDEERHTAYLGDRIGWFERRFSRRAVKSAMERLEDVFEKIGLVYYGALQDYFQRAAQESIAA